MRKIPILLTIFLFAALYCFAQTENSKLKKVDWMFSEKDFSVNIKEEKINKGKHNLEISRKSTNETENLLIRKAEALYPKETNAENTETTTVEYQGKVFSPTPEENPFWSNSSFDGVKIARIISTRSINYYKELSFAFRNDKNPTSIGMSETSFNYSATIKHYDKYEINDEKFENVNVVRMTLSWSQYCGNLCAMGFDREKTVIFDKNNKPVAMVVGLDEGSWVS